MSSHPLLLALSFPLALSCASQQGAPARAEPAAVVPVSTAAPVAAAPVSAAASSSIAPPASAGAPATRAKVLAMLDGVAIASYPPVGFDRLAPRERALAYHLAAAAIAGDPIYSMQTSRFARPAQQAVRAIYARRASLPAPLAEQITRYRQMLFVHHGLHDHRTGQKYTPPIARRDFEQAARAAGVEVKADLLQAMFDPTVLPALINKSPGPGKDPLVESAANHYENVTSKQLDGYRDKFALNSRIVKDHDRLVEQVYRTGESSTPPGLAAPELGRVIEHLQAASLLAPAAQSAAFEHLIRYFRTGDNREFRQHDIVWLGQVFPVDYILGFIETYTDVRQRKGAFEGVVMIRDPERDPPLQILAREASYFEQKLPFAAQFKRETFRTPAAAAVNLLAATGESGSFTFGGVNLPNAQDLRQAYGSKNFIALSTVDTRRELLTTKIIDEFAPAELRAEVQRCAPALTYASIGFHEVTGHGSGKTSPSLKVDPHAALAPHYSAMEEGRADLVADYLMSDPKTVEAGILPDAACARVYPTFKSMRFFTNLLNVPRGDVAEEDHLRGALIAQGVLLEKGVLSIEKREGKTFFLVKDPDAWRAVAGELLAEHQRIKATGDRAALSALIEKYGTRINVAWRDEVLARVSKLGLPAAVATVPPLLSPIRDAHGAVVDATAEQVTSLDAYIDAVEQLAAGN